MSTPDQQKTKNVNVSQKPLRQAKPALHYEDPNDKPYKVLNITFASKKTFTNFMLTNFLIVVVPIVMVVCTRVYLQDNQNISETNKTILMAAPAVLFMNIVMGIYVYLSTKDPTNYSSKKIQEQQKQLKQKEQQQGASKNKKQ